MFFAAPSADEEEPVNRGFDQPAVVTDQKPHSAGIFVERLQQTLPARRYQDDWWGSSRTRRLGESSVAIASISRARSPPRQLRQTGRPEPLSPERPNPPSWPRNALVGKASGRNPCELFWSAVGVPSNSIELMLARNKPTISLRRLASTVPACAPKAGRPEAWQASTFRCRSCRAVRCGHRGLCGATGPSETGRSGWYPTATFSQREERAGLAENGFRNADRGNLLVERHLRSASSRADHLEAALRLGVPLVCL